MFTPIHLLPQSVSAEGDNNRQRWGTDEGRKIHDLITSKLRTEKSKHFLQSDFDCRRLGFMKDTNDFRGFSFLQEEIVFAQDSEVFTGVNLSDAEFVHTKMTNASFFDCHTDFARFHDCTFGACFFWFANFYACKFEKVNFANCVFFERNSFYNCEFKDCAFAQSFFSENVFFDCKFDTKTTIESKFRREIASPKTAKLENTSLADLYFGIQEAYSAGGAVSKSRKFTFLQRQATTKYNTDSLREKLFGLAFEFLAGYGLKPLRVILCMLGVFLAAFLFFCWKLETDFSATLLFTSGAFFTFGAKADMLDKPELFYRLVYIATSFCGVCLTALFITVLANYIMRER